MSFHIVLLIFNKKFHFERMWFYFPIKINNNEGILDGHLFFLHINRLELNTGQMKSKNRRDKTTSCNKFLENVNFLSAMSLGQRPHNTMRIF